MGPFLAPFFVFPGAFFGPLNYEKTHTFCNLPFFRANFGADFGTKFGTDFGTKFGTDFGTKFGTEFGTKFGPLFRPSFSFFSGGFRGRFSGSPIRAVFGGFFRGWKSLGFPHFLVGAFSGGGNSGGFRGSSGAQRPRIHSCTLTACLHAFHHIRQHTLLHVYCVVAVDSCTTLLHHVILVVVVHAQ